MIVICNKCGCRVRIKRAGFWESIFGGDLICGNCGAVIYDEMLEKVNASREPIGNGETSSAVTYLNNL